MALIRLSNQSLTDVTALPAAATSSGVYLGGTGSANYLDKYEEGTWTPQIYKGTTQITSPTTAVGRYRVIGNILFLTWYFYKTSGAIGATSGGWLLKGLPFTVITGAPNNTIPASYLGIGSQLYQNAPSRWQANYSDALALYGNYASTDWTSGYLEFSGNGFLTI